MFNRYQILLLLTYLNKHLDNKLLEWEISRRSENIPSQERRYIETKVAKTPAPKEPFVLLLTFIKEYGVHSKTLASLTTDYKFKKPRPERIKMVIYTLSDLGIVNLE